MNNWQDRVLGFIYTGLDTGSDDESWDIVCKTEKYPLSVLLRRYVSLEKMADKYHQQRLVVKCQQMQMRLVGSAKEEQLLHLRHVAASFNLQKVVEKCDAYVTFSLNTFVPSLQHSDLEADAKLVILNAVCKTLQESLIANAPYGEE